MEKMGFWSVLAIVLGAQIGSGMLMLPATLAPFGLYTICGWGIACIGAIALACVFSRLCFIIPKTGGPHAYVKAAFGDTASFFTGWTYWLVSWISTSIVVISCAAYLSPFLGNGNEDVYLYCELAILAIITYINCVSVSFSGQLEFVLTLLKFAPLLIMPFLTIPFFNGANFEVSTEVANMPTTSVINHVSLLAFWGFIGVECGTAPAGAVKNPGRNIPLAIMFGTVCTALLYLANCIGIMGTIPGNILADSKAPYVDFAKMAFSSNAECIMGIAGFIICLGTLNAWTLTSGQIALGLAQDKLLPKMFSVTNKAKSPYINILISSIGIAVILLLTRQKSIAKQVMQIIDFSVVSFLFVYLISSLSYLKIIYKKKNYFQIALGTFATCFCVWIISNSELDSIIIASGFSLSGIVILPFLKSKNIADGKAI